MNIPFVDLQRIHKSLTPQITRVFEQQLSRGDFILGREVEKFETAFAQYVGTEHCIGVSTGLDALILVLAATGVKENDEVITVPTTFIATALAISQVGARPVLVDVDESGFGFDLSALERAVSSRTKAIIPVHLYGRPERMQEILRIAGKNGLLTLEDACQAHGAYYLGARVGSLGNAAAFSFYPAKNLGCLGDGGAVTTSDGVLAEKIRLLRNYGSTVKYRHDLLGRNNRLDSMQAAVLALKLPYLDQWNLNRRLTAKKYNSGLRGVGDLRMLDVADSVCHLFVICSNRRDELAEWLGSRGVGTGIHYPVPIHLQPAYRFLGYQEGDFPRAEQIAKTSLSLPMFPEMNDREIQVVVNAVREFFGSEPLKEVS